MKAINEENLPVPQSGLLGVETKGWSIESHQSMFALA
jgi:hypothetical protein